MLIRIGRTVAVTSTVLIAMVGLFARPSAMLTAGLLAVLLVGPLTAMCVYSNDPQGNPVRLGAMAAAAVTVLSMVTAGLVALLGDVAAPVIAMVLVAAGVWAWHRGRSWRGRAFTTPETPQPGPAHPHNTARHAPQPGSPPVRLPVIATGSASTTELCVTWRRTYWLLHDLPPVCPDRDVVIEVRGRLLDEFERRDPDGFGRWLDSEPRAGSAPGRYLTATTERPEGTR